MTLPFNYRPVAPVDPDDGETDDWADNWVSNSMAWVSRTFMPTWCETEEHWTSRIANYFFTTCPCCLFIRGVVVGLVVAIATSTIISIIIPF